MITFLIALALQDSPLAEDVLKNWQHPWAGFAPGSIVRCLQTSKRPDISQEGELVYRDETDELSYAVVTQEGEDPTIRIRNGDVSTDIPYFTAPPGWFRGKAERKGKEVLKVGDRAYECTVTKFVLDEGKDLSQVTTVHTAEGSPVWALRVRVETYAGASMNTAEEERWVAADQALKIGDRELLCQVIETTTEVANGPTTIKREWRSDAIPGRVAKRELKVIEKGKEVPSAALQMVVVSFDAK